MMNQVMGLCNDVANRRMLCAILTTAGGLHMAMTESQPVLGMLDLPSVGWFSAQHLLGSALVVCGGCCLISCMN